MHSKGRRWLRRVRWALTGSAIVYGLSWGLVSLAILGMSTAAHAEEAAKAPEVPGVGKFGKVDGKLYRGSAPSLAGYRSLHALGVRTVVDLRAEVLAPARLARPAQAGLVAVRIPVRDGQPPSEAQIRQFLAVVGKAKDLVFVHCGAGVGRTGSMAAAYLVRTGQAGARTATERSLAVGPPTLEQVAFMRGLRKGPAARPSGLVVAFSRLADSPRRTWSRLR